MPLPITEEEDTIAKTEVLSSEGANTLARALLSLTKVEARIDMYQYTVRWKGQMD